MNPNAWKKKEDQTLRKKIDIKVTDRQAKKDREVDTEMKTETDRWARGDNRCHKNAMK